MALGQAFVVSFMVHAASMMALFTALCQLTWPGDSAWFGRGARAYKTTTERPIGG